MYIGLEAGLSITQAWIQGLKFLADTEFTERFEGEVQPDPHTVAVQNRLTEMKKARTTIDELLRVLPVEARIGIGTQGEALLAPLQRVPIKDAGSFAAQVKWAAAYAEFNSLLLGSGVEKQAAMVLKSRIFALVDRPQLLVSEFRNFPELLFRPNIATE